MKTIDFRVVTALQDRHGTVLDAAGVDLTHFRKNPVVLFNHNYDQVIGRSPEIYRSGSDIIGPVHFDTDDPFAASIARKAEQGFINGASAGFIVHEQEGANITRAELVEFSVVTVPSNPGALAVRKRSLAGKDIVYARAHIQNRRGLSLETVTRIIDKAIQDVIPFDQVRRLERMAAQIAADYACNDLRLKNVKIYFFSGDSKDKKWGYVRWRFDLPYVFIRAGLHPYDTAKTVLHECRHLWQMRSYKGEYRKHREFFEADAVAYERVNIGQLNDNRLNSQILNGSLEAPTIHPLCF